MTNKHPKAWETYGFERPEYDRRLDAWVTHAAVEAPNPDGSTTTRAVTVTISRSGLAKLARKAVQNKTGLSQAGVITARLQRR